MVHFVLEKHKLLQKVGGKKGIKDKLILMQNMFEIHTHKTFSKIPQNVCLFYLSPLFGDKCVV